MPPHHQCGSSSLSILLFSLLFLSLHPLSTLSSPSPFPSPSPLSDSDISSPPSSSSSPSPSLSPSQPPSSSSSSDSNITSPSPSSPSPSPSPSPAASDIAAPSLSDTAAPSPSPSPDAADEFADAQSHAQKGTPSLSGGGGGMNGGHKAGVAFGVIGAACVVGAAGYIYKKRQDNIRRTQYGYTARTTMI